MWKNDSTIIFFKKPRLRLAAQARSLPQIGRKILAERQRKPKGLSFLRMETTDYSKNVNLSPFGHKVYCVWGGNNGLPKHINLVVFWRPDCLLDGGRPPAVPTPSLRPYSFRWTSSPKAIGFIFKNKNKIAPPPPSYYHRNFPRTSPRAGKKRKIINLFKI